jgi:hypothetical protein
MTAIRHFVSNDKSGLKTIFPVKMDSRFRAHIRVNGQTAFAVAFVCAVMLNLGQSPLGTKFRRNEVPFGICRYSFERQRQP